MTVMKQAANNSGSDFHKKSDFWSPKPSVKFVGRRESDDPILYADLKVGGEVDVDQESAGSSEEMESPKSVTKVRKWPTKKVNVCVHSQVLRIREEDTHIGEDFREVLSSKDKVGGHHVATHVDLLLFRKPILPSSPLGGEAAIKIVH